MQTQELDREEQWIAKYRAALAASPSRRVSLFDPFAMSWQSLFEKPAIRFRHISGEKLHVMNRCRLGKGCITSFPMARQT